MHSSCITTNNYFLCGSVFALEYWYQINLRKRNDKYCELIQMFVRIQFKKQTVFKANILGVIATVKLR